MNSSGQALGSRRILASALVLAALGCWSLGIAAAPAAAIVTETSHGRASYVPLNEAAKGIGGAPLRSTAPSGSPPLLYHGGPVMHSQTAYAIFWAPAGYSFPTGYTGAITAYLKHVAADSGLPSNVYSVGAQYADGSGHAAYSVSYGGSVADAHAYPTSGTCAAYTGFGGESYSACITDAKLEAEVNTVVAEQGWPHGLEAEYYVVFPPHAGGCFDSTNSECFDTAYCAYHSYAESLAGVAVYSNIGYAPGDPSGCGVGEYPNGHANGNVDDTLSGFSHEANESITDPLLNAWYDVLGYENGDECRNSSDDYGSPLGGSAGSLFNQLINGGEYYLQQEWSNDVADCAQRVSPATPAIADPGSIGAGEPVEFDGTGSVAGSGGIEGYGWDFGDGGSGSGSNPTHTYTAPGVFAVRLTVTDDGGFQYQTTRQVHVAGPPTATTGPATNVGSGAATVTGTVVPNGGATSYRFEFGPTPAYGSVTSLGSAGEGTAPLPVAGALEGLSPGTEYHYRLVAASARGGSIGEDRSFTTSAAPTPTAPRPAAATAVAFARGVALVKGGRARLVLSCPRSGACSGVVRLAVRIRTPRGKLRNLTIGRRAFSLAAGESAVISVSLTGTGKALVRRAGKSGQTVKLRGTGVQGRAVKLRGPA